jgi:hypothetical protein
MYNVHAGYETKDMQVQHTNTPKLLVRSHSLVKGNTLVLGVA